MLELQRRCLVTIILIALSIPGGSLMAQTALSPMIFPSSRDQVELVGVVQSFAFIAPQSVITLSVQGSGADAAQWRVTTLSAAELRRFGWTSTSVYPGEIIHLAGSRKADAALEIELTRLTRANGETLYPGEQTLLGEVLPGLYLPVAGQGFIDVNFNHFGFSDASFRFTQFDVALLVPDEGILQGSFEMSLLAENIAGASPELARLLKSNRFFDASQFPLIHVQGGAATDAGKNKLLIEAQLEIREIAHPVTLEVTLNKVGVHPQSGRTALGFSGTAQLNRSNWMLNEMSTQTGDAVEIDFELELELAESSTPSVQPAVDPFSISNP